MKCEITDDCIACVACLALCKVNAIVQGDEYYEITDAYTGCRDCVDICPTGAFVEYIPFEKWICGLIVKMNDMVQ